MSQLVSALALVALSSLGVSAPRSTPPQAGAVTVRGELFDTEKQPVVGFPLSVAVYSDGQRIFETTVVTAARGRYELRLPPPPSVSGKLRVRVGVDSEGYQARAGFRTYWGTSVRMPDLVATEGWTAHLRVFDEQRAPVTARTRVSSFDRASPKMGLYGPVGWSDPDQRPTIEWNPLTERFDVFFAQPTTAFAFARYGRLGSVFVKLELYSGKHGHEFSAVLCGGGELAGTLRGPDGGPLGGVSLIAYPSDWESRSNRLQTSIELARGGLCTATAYTQPDGSFRFRALQPGTYVIEVDSSGMGRSDPQLERKTFPLGSEGIELPLRAYRLVVEVRDEQGQPVEKDKLLCFRRREDRWDEKLYSHELGEGRFSFKVEPGATYTYGWCVPNRPLVEGVVSIEEGAWVTRRALELRARVEAQSLEVHVTREDGEPIGGFGWSVGLEIRSLATGQLLRDERAYRHEGGRQSFRLPAGRYELRAIPGPGPRFCGNDPTPPVPCGPVFQEIQVRSDQPNEVDVRLWTGGRIHVFLELPEGVCDPRLIRPTGISDCDDQKRRNDLFVTEKDNPCGLIYWEDPVHGERRPMELYFRAENLGYCASSERVLPGTDFVSHTLLPPGTHELEFRVANFQPVTVSVDIRTGERTEVRVPLRY